MKNSQVEFGIIYKFNVFTVTYLIEKKPQKLTSRESTAAYIINVHPLNVALKQKRLRLR